MQFDQNSALLYLATSKEEMFVAIEKRDNNNIIPINEYKLFITDELLTLLVTETNCL